LLKKSLISVAEAVSTILTPDPVFISLLLLHANREKECSTVLLKITASYTSTHIAEEEKSANCRPSNSDFPHVNVWETI
jgi:hypothetical protein